MRDQLKLQEKRRASRACLCVLNCGKAQYNTPYPCVSSAPCPIRYSWRLRPRDQIWSCFPLSNECRVHKCTTLHARNVDGIRSSYHEHTLPNKSLTHYKPYTIAHGSTLQLYLHVQTPGPKRCSENVCHGEKMCMRHFPARPTMVGPCH